jgi:hypothetical protein
MVSYFKYALWGLAIDDLTHIWGACPVGSTDASCPYYYGSDALELLFGLGGSKNKWVAWACQVAFLVGLTLGGAFVYQFIVWSRPDTPESPLLNENDDHAVDVDSEQQKALEALPDGGVIQWHSLTYTVPVRDEKGKASTKTLLNEVYGLGKVCTVLYCTVLYSSRVTIVRSSSSILYKSGTLVRRDSDACTCTRMIYYTNCRCACCLMLYYTWKCNE